MWTLKQIMENGAMGVQITISGKLRGDRSAFEKHTAGILPRAGHHAEIIVEQDIAHVKTAMGLIGIRIRIARKEKLIPEFELKESKVQKEKPKENKVEEVETESGKVEVIKVEGSDDKAKSESEVIELEEKKMEKIETLEEEEEKMK